jgi:hypothetical protein
VTKIRPSASASRFVDLFQFYQPDVKKDPPPAAIRMFEGVEEALSLSVRSGAELSLQMLEEVRRARKKNKKALERMQGLVNSTLLVPRGAEVVEVQRLQKETQTAEEVRGGGGGETLK